MHRLITILALAGVAALFAACNPGGSEGVETDDPFASPSTPVMTDLPSLEPSPSTSP